MAKQTYDWKHRMDMELSRIDKEITNPNDRKLVDDFINDCKSERLSPARIIYYTQVLRLIKRKTDIELAKITKEDMKKLMGGIEDSDYSEWTKQGFRIGMKKFYRWLYVEKFKEDLKPKEYPDVVSWINTTMKENKKKLPEDMLTEDDVKELIDGCTNIRNKCLVALLWDSGCRIGEVLNLQLKHIVFDRYGAQIIVQGKTGSRRVRLVSSVPYLANWKENHPNKKDSNSYLFVNIGNIEQGARVTYQGVESLLRKLKARIGFKKRINPHNFRHSRATFMASRVKEAVMKETFGWTQKSQMVATYVHLSGREVDNEILKANGIVTEETEQESKLKPKKCVRCGYENEATALFCSKCSMVMNEKVAKEIDKEEGDAKKVFNKVTSEKGFNISRELLKETLKEMIKSGEIKL